VGATSRLMGWRTALAAGAQLLLSLAGDAQPTSDSAARIGFRQLTIPDARYRWPGGDRPIRLSVWYPAAAGSRAMTFADYAAADERGTGDLTRLVRTLVGESVTDSAITALRREPVRAEWKAPPAAGRFPVVLLGAGLDSRAYIHDALAENLASHGFVAVSVASEDTTPASPLSFDTTAVAVLLHDLRLVLKTLETDPQIDVTRVGLVAWSLSGIAMVRLAAEQPSITALVSLDSGLGYAYGTQLLAAWGGRPPPERVSMMHVEARAPARVAVQRDEALCSRRRAVECFRSDALRHAQMTALASRMTIGPERPRVQDAYRAVVEATRAFLAGHVTGRMAGRADPPIALPADSTLLRRITRP
jgi:dienelactone hydrolase